MLAVLIAAVAGLLVGSFLGTLVLRPPKGLPVVTGRSACPECGHQLTAIELIPLMSWAIQRRRCRACGRPIPAFYPAMEFAGAAVAAAAVAFVPWPVSAAACLGGWIALVILAKIVYPSPKH
jgi:leader peptidase (prepilin peptidase)/N-methyltransferase